MQLSDLGKITFIGLLFAFASWSATFWPPMEPNTIKPVLDGVIEEDEYPDIHPFKDLNLYVYNDEEYIYIGLSSSGLGWLAIGFSPVNVHEGGNFVFGAVEDGKTIVSDQFGIEQYRHMPDTSLGGTYDIVGFAGREDRGTVIEFIIKMNSGDPYDVVLKRGESYSIILACHENDDDTQSKHTRRYDHSIKLR